MLRRLIGETGEEQGVTWEGAWRIAVSLTADILHRFVCELDRDPDDVAAWFDASFASRLTDVLTGAIEQLQASYPLRDSPLPS